MIWFQGQNLMGWVQISHDFGLLRSKLVVILMFQVKFDKICHNFRFFNVKISLNFSFEVKILVFQVKAVHF